MPIENFKQYLNKNFFYASKRPVGDFRYEVNQRALSIANKTTKPINVFYSGGIDSEVVLLSFIENKIPFTAVIKKYNNDYNKHDIDFALKFVKKRNIPYIVEEEDLDEYLKWFETGYHSFVKVGSGLQVKWIVQKNSENVHSVLGAGEQTYTSKKKVKLESDYFIKSVYRARYNWDVSETFYIGQPEMTNCISEFAKSQLDNIDNIEKYGHNIKESLYSSYFELEKRPKFTGFELLYNKVLWVYRRRLARFPTLSRRVSTRKSVLYDR